MKLAEIKATCPQWKWERDKFNLLCLYIYRPLSFYFAYPFIRLGISANSVTLIGLAIGLTGCFLLTREAYWVVILGAIILNFRDVFDYVDGTVARATDTATKGGWFLDDLCDRSIGILTPVAVGIGLFLYPDTLLGGTTYLILGFLCGILYTFNAFFIIRLGDIFGTDPRSFYRPKGEEKGLWGLIYIMGINIINASAVALFVFALFGVLGFYLILYTLAHACELGVLVIVVFKKGNKRLNEKV